MLVQGNLVHFSSILFVKDKKAILRQLNRVLTAVKGLTPNLTTTDCQNLGFAAAIYPCTGFIPAMLAMQRSYTALKDEGTDLHHCKGKRIQDFFEQVGLKESFDFDTMIENYSKEEVEHVSDF